MPQSGNILSDDITTVATSNLTSSMEHSHWWITWWDSPTDPLFL